ncbi:hypothetical protein CFBP6600_44680 (plasmid) [Xanthomonas arboricola pv. corylina]|uniref:hypothetical protein n=1 Tax=Xanthomonas arboricola TaxID=56448 RepID=UPI001CE6979B|nr:hypothetical protein [Xanthomonas arboricola]CAE6868295.1 hypothetical protein CFBP6600_44680 [Xanthomonas arboricola pv. corylina]CAE6868303.1 hypothetical protein CFBP6600_44680 [Xanthomonas arboricola pv. corylina]
MPFLEGKGIASSRENQRLGETRPFKRSDMEKGVARRNTSVAGPLLHELNMAIQKSIYKKDEESISDLRSKKLGEMKYIPICHFKMNDDCSGFEDSSGLADSFTGYNVSAYINHARLLSGEDRLSKQDVVAIVGCLNAVYDNASSERHTLREIAHGCFVGAGYKVEDAEAFTKMYARIPHGSFMVEKRSGRPRAAKESPPKNPAQALITRSDWGKALKKRVGRDSCKNGQKVS